MNHPLWNSLHIQKSIFMILFIFHFVFANTTPSVMPKIINTLPHFSLGFTQGLEIKGDTLIESTGLYHQSKIFFLSLKNGKILKQVSLQKFFGEGVTLISQKLYQLTWKYQKAFVWEYPSLNIIDSMDYHGEGWGLTHHEKKIIMSNGSDTLYVRDTNFKIIKKIAVFLNKKPLKALNELEYANGFVYANIFQTNHIAKIDAKTGQVVLLINCSELFLKNATHKKPYFQNVLNGIAYNSKTDTFYITGKRWKFIFEIKIPNF